MPIHNGKQPAWFKNIVDGACKAWLVQYPVERVCEKYAVNTVADHLCKVISICLNEHAVGPAAFGQPDPRRFKQFAVYVDGDYRAPNLGQLQCEPTVPGTQIDNGHAGCDPDVPDNPLWIGP